MLKFEELEAEARASGALRRQVRKLHPVRMLEGMLCTRGQSTGHLSHALSYLRLHYGIEVNRSAFYKRLTEGYARFVRAITERVLRMRIADVHPELRGRLEAFRDLWAYDSTTIRLRQALVGLFSSGGASPKAGVKLHAGVCIRSGALHRPKLSEEKEADCRAVDLGQACEDVLILLDRGYSAHALFQSIHQSGGLYLTRLKGSTNPRITAVWQGGPRAKQATGKTLDAALDDGDLTLDGQVLDLEVQLSLKPRKGQPAQTLPARVVGLPRTHAEDKEQTWWYLTNLPQDDYEPELVGKFYVLRWQIELLWKQLKSRFRMDDIHVLNKHNVQMVIDLSILSYLLTLGVMQACTTEAEREHLSIGMTALAMQQAMGRLADFVDSDDPSVRLDIAARLRRFILSAGREPNPKRARKRLLNSLQHPRLPTVAQTLAA